MPRERRRLKARHIWVALKSQWIKLKERLLAQPVTKLGWDVLQERLYAFTCMQMPTSFWSSTRNGLLAGVRCLGVGFGVVSLTWQASSILQKKIKLHVARIHEISLTGELRLISAPVSARENISKPKKQDKCPKQCFRKVRQTNTFIRPFDQSVERKLVQGSMLKIVFFKSVLFFPKRKTCRKIGSSSHVTCAACHSEEMSEDMSERMSEDMSERMSKDMS